MTYDANANPTKRLRFFPNLISSPRNYRRWKTVYKVDLVELSSSYSSLVDKDSNIKSHLPPEDCYTASLLYHLGHQVYKFANGYTYGGPTKLRSCMSVICRVAERRSASPLQGLLLQLPECQTRNGLLEVHHGSAGDFEAVHREIIYDN
ncbi:jg8412 [Pararge aegeria aegeria]|uniref:Jg8412 protein n=1 Tax=Pararge aegeria aegeria TaxID=348720 RepID=A0A8S4SLA3_9NEOP|nr:jg8412 [Pararge aegeria aegeria]